MENLLSFPFKNTKCKQFSAHQPDAGEEGARMGEHKSRTREVFGELIGEYTHPKGEGRIVKIRLDEWWPSPEKHAALWAENKRLRERVAELEAALKECAEELRVEIAAQYPERGFRPDELRRYKRDMAPVEKAETLLSQGGREDG
jgi:hypothetical protein